MATEAAKLVGLPGARYPYRKLISGPAGPDTDFELHVQGPVTAKELYRIANAIMQVHGWLSADESSSVTSVETGELTGRNVG